MVGRFKNFFGETLSRFRSPQSTYSTICAAIIAFSLAPCPKVILFDFEESLTFGWESQNFQT
jgi:hypothetical protein